MSERSLFETMERQGREIERWLKISERWTDEECARVLIGWLGTARAREMNDFLEGKERSDG